MTTAAGTGVSSPKVLILYYSLSGQTTKLLNRLQSGLKKGGAEVVVEKIVPRAPWRFPFGTIPVTVFRMVTTFLRQRLPILPLAPVNFQPYDLIILGGPTWSYNPSGPVLALLDRDGPRLFKGKRVLPFISCRGYWRLHWWGLRRLLERCGALVDNVMVFSHPNPEPWRTIGVFLKLAGRNPERSSWLSRRYRRYGHSPGQGDEAFRFGLLIGEALRRSTPLAELDFQTPTALPRL